MITVHADTDSEAADVIRLLHHHLPSPVRVYVGQNTVPEPPPGNPLRESLRWLLAQPSRPQSYREVFLWLRRQPGGENLVRETVYRWLDQLEARQAGLRADHQGAGEAGR